MNPGIIFLPGDDESANDRLPRFLEEFLAAGAVGKKERPEDYKWLLRHYSDGKTLYNHGGTSCALSLGAACIATGIQAQRPSPGGEGKPYGITTWLHASQFVGAEWIHEHEIEIGNKAIQRGDIPYWCFGTKDRWKKDEESGVWKIVQHGTWRGDTRGHVACTLVGAGLMWHIAQGGGGPDGSRVKIASEPGDISYHYYKERLFRGVWRPDLMRATKLTRPEATLPDPFVPLKRGDHGPRVGRLQTKLKALGYTMTLTFRKGYADEGFGTETEAAVQQAQLHRGLPTSGVVDARTWHVIMTATEPGGYKITVT